MTIDLRSDTITRPTTAMLEAMMSAEVGDDVLGDDPTVNRFQERIADLFGMEEALFCPSGTMTNQIAIRTSTVPQDEVICHRHSHVFLYEGGGMMYNSMVSPKLLEGAFGKITGAQIVESVNPDDIHKPVSKLVVLENTMNKGGGSIYHLDEIVSIKKACDEKGLLLHLDGARLFNALVETEDDPMAYGELFDTISICFSKGLGAPVGSVLLGSSSSIKHARRVRKALGGGMRQAGYLAAACHYALDHHIERLKQDHVRAKEIATVLHTCNYIKDIYPVHTNIVIAELEEAKGEIWLIERLKESDIHIVPFGKNLVRFVTHLDFTDEQLSILLTKLRNIT